MSKNKVCPDCKKGVLHKREYNNRNGKVLHMLYCSNCGYEKKLSNIREVMVRKEEEQEV